MNKFVSHPGWHKDANGTSLSGYIEGSYNDLVDVFGPPLADTDEYKVDAEWNITVEDVNTGEKKDFFTIYNYKTGRNYLGKDGQDVEDITTWHVGSKKTTTVWHIDEHFEDKGVRLSVKSSRF